MIEIDTSLIQNMAESGKRIDSRQFSQYRNITIETNAVTSAEGSSRVRIGNTEVLAGIKMEPGTPFSDTPDAGVLMVGAELVPLASPEFEPGPPGEEAVELSRVVDRAIRESKCVDFNKLCIKEGEKVWMMFVDIDVLNDDGNLFDACGIAAISALLNSTIPELDSEGKIISGKKGSEKIPIKGIPLSTTIVKINGKLMVDPNSAETRAMDARLTVGTADKDGKTVLCSMQKGGESGITEEDVDAALELAIEKSNEVRELIKENV